MNILGIDGSPGGGGRTAHVVTAVLNGASISGADTSFVRLSENRDYSEVIARMEAADGIVLGSPVYRASFAWPLKVLLDQITRGLFEDGPSVLQGKAVAIVMSGGTMHHFLGLNDLRNVLGGFFAAHVIPPGLYVSSEGFIDEGQLSGSFAGEAQRQGQALNELAEALSNSVVLKTLVPQV